ncbi:alpha-L-fucosidase domain-containing protein [Ditylenchus destructor]|uniref:Putative alpha-L-fucosidase n=1 Tax=Ditylenchus destructor TaxID=166010 RepID=A0AAD4MGX9_9BILA|nr:alpha-L-fucosidase domain-containing protein [Ditylenchus destructor]
MSAALSRNPVPDWKSIDSRPLPAWYDNSKLGIFVHWGVYSVPAFNDGEWLWYHWKEKKDPQIIDFVKSHYGSNATYADFANEFTAEDFNADNFAKIVKASGARYFVLTTKHHDGFTLWPSKTSWNWNAKDIGPHRDLVQELKQSILKQNLHFGLYLSLYDWFHPLYLSDVANNRTEYVEQVMLPQLHEIVDEYLPDVIWSDGDWDRTDEYWKSKEFIAWLYNESPIKDKVVINDRWGRGIKGKHGGFLTHENNFDPGHLLARKWENCLTLDRQSWGYRRNINSSDVLSFKELVSQLARTISCGGNMLLNIGPDKQGRIIPIFEERLRQLGHFVRTNEEAIFGTKPWIHQNDTDNIWYTSRLRDSYRFDSRRYFNPQDQLNTIIYAFILGIPHNNIVHLDSVKATLQTRVSLLGTYHEFQISKSGSLSVDLSQV